MDSLEKLTEHAEFLRQRTMNERERAAKRKDKRVKDRPGRPSLMLGITPSEVVLLDLLRSYGSCGAVRSPEEYFDEKNTSNPSIPDASSDLFFESLGTKAVEKAIKLCKQCPLRNPCRSYALSLGVEDGIWGGMTPNERKDYLRATAAPDEVATATSGQPASRAS